MTSPPASPPLTTISLNARAFAVLALLTIGTGIACGLVPAIRGSRLDPIGSIKEANLTAPPSPLPAFPARPARGAAARARPRAARRLRACC